jgi:hypothetical protein
MSDDDPQLAALWARVLERWTDDKQHGLFIEYCRSTQQLAEAARRYRLEVDATGGPYRDAGRAEVARKRLSAISIVAMAELAAMQSDKPSEMRAILRTAARWGLILFLTGMVAFLLLTLLSR